MTERDENSQMDEMSPRDKERAKLFFDQLMQDRNLGVSSEAGDLPTWKREGLRRLNKGEELSERDVLELWERDVGLDNTLGSTPNQPLHPDGKCEPGIPEDELIDIMQRFNEAIEEGWPDTLARRRKRERRLKGLE